METNDLIAPILIIIGGILTLLSVLPIISDFVPLLTFSGGGATAYITFWGTVTKIAGTTSTDTGKPSGWTALGLSPIIMFLIFAILGIIAIIIAINAFYKFIPTDKVAGMPFMGLIGIIVGIIDLLLLLLIFLGDSSNLAKTGFSPAQTGYSIGLGYWILVISMILILIGAIVNFVIKPKTTS